MPTAAQREAAAQVMEHLCECPLHGYAQDARWGGGGTCDVDTAVGTVQVREGDRDCSSAGVDCYEAAGIDTGGATYSGNYYECLMSTGDFRAHRMSDGYYCDDGYVAKRGDCYLAHNGSSQHVAMCISSDPDLLGEFAINSWGGITGDAAGDQTGRESWVHEFYGGNWDWCFEVVVDGGEWSPEPTPAPRPEPKAKHARYWGMVGGEWLPKMVDHVDTGGSSDDYAGVMGRPLEYFACNYHKYRVMTEEGGWLDWIRKYDLADLVDGAAGDGSPILAVEIRSKHAHLEVHTVDGRWLPAKGYKAGDGTPVDAVRLEYA